jgi:hypothetical protein
MYEGGSGKSLAWIESRVENLKLPPEHISTFLPTAFSHLSRLQDSLQNSLAETRGKEELLDSSELSIFTFPLFLEKSRESVLSIK